MEKGRGKLAENRTHGCVVNGLHSVLALAFASRAATPRTAT